MTGHDRVESRASALGSSGPQPFLRSIARPPSGRLVDGEGGRPLMGGEAAS
jgi:hypothetical protein